MATILVVDDRAANRELLVILGDRKHRLLEAADGEDALRIARIERPDLVISDILMPTMDGFEFVRRLRANADLANTKVIFYTAPYHKREAEGLAHKSGVTQIIARSAKPEAIFQARAQSNRNA
jgi:two-component system cell cycle sensor histidine kinase/response regulator CckA